MLGQLLTVFYYKHSFGFSDKFYIFKKNVSTRIENGDTILKVIRSEII